MFIGHIALGFAAKRLNARPSLALYVTAALFPDVLWPVFLFLGWERVVIAPGDTRFTPLAFVSYPISHSLLMTVVWGTLVGWLYARRGGDRSGGVLIAALVVSHWVLDFVTHRPDMPLWPGPSPLFGLGLWNSVIWTVVVEVLMFAAGVLIYLRATRARDRSGRIGLAVLVIVLMGLYVANVEGPPPPSIGAIVALSMVMIVVFTAVLVWIDRHRENRA